VTHAWIIRAGANDEFEKMAFDHGVVGVGWRRVPDLASYPDLPAIRKVVQATYPEISAKTRDVHAVQLYAFRSAMDLGDLVVMVRSKSPDVAIGLVDGGYEYRPTLTARHVRAVRWLRTEVRRSEVGGEMLDLPALSVIYRITRSDALARLEKAVEDQVASAGPSAQAPQPAGADISVPELDAVLSQPSVAYANFSRNLNYARNLTAAGSHLEQLQVALFEVTDVYRAAWVQTVAALDHWAHQEIYDRMLRLSEQPAAAKPDKYRQFDLPLGIFEEVHTGKLSMREALERQMRAKLGYETYQNPDKIRQGFSYVANTNDLWLRVAKVLNEQSGKQGGHTGVSVQNRLKEIVQRRNKIAHEYDENPVNAPDKNSIDAASTMQTIDWVDRVAAAILVVIDQS
jgi:hypothetical protein